VVLLPETGLSVATIFISQKQKVGDDRKGVTEMNKVNPTADDKGAFGGEERGPNRDGEIIRYVADDGNDKGGLCESRWAVVCHFVFAKQHHEYQHKDGKLLQRVKHQNRCLCRIVLITFIAFFSLFSFLFLFF